MNAPAPMRLLLCSLLLTVLVAPAHAQEKLRVLATFSPVFSLAKNVTGDAAELEMLLPADAGPHDYALAPGDLKKIAQADVIISNGLGIEAWLAKAIRSGAKKGMVQIVASDGIKTLKSEEEEHSHGHDHGEANPHVWLDPQRAIQQVTNIRDGLLKCDPVNGVFYAANSHNFIVKLQALDAEIRGEIERLPNKRLLTFHDSFPYFAERYGLEIVAVFQAFPGREPTPKYLQRLRATITAKNVKALFAEPQFSPKVLESIARDAAVPIAVIDPLETGEPSADLYERVMRNNVRSLVSALSQP